MPPIDWAAIITAVIAAIQDCQKNKTPKARIRSGVRGPTGLQRIAFERRLRLQLGMNPGEFQKKVAPQLKSVYAEGASASDADIDELIERAS